MVRTRDWSPEALLTVNGGGRGFIVDSELGPLVITAAHCLPSLPVPDPGAPSATRTYAELLGALGTTTPSVAAECIFVDPIAHVAVLSEPDPAKLWRLQRAYHRLVDNRPRLRVADGTHEPAPGRLLTHSGEWSACTFTLNKAGNWLWLEGTTWEAVKPGTSGSPILAADSRAVGLISGGGGSRPNPALTGCLPKWLLSKTHG